jgi:glycosyltransferase involved in cell wall biosynthesis
VTVTEIDRGVGEERHVSPPRVSVVITTYNTARYLPETLDSVFAQTYPELEVIVVDDGSTDDSVARARDHGDRVIVIERPHAGLGPARAVGMARATGDYFACLDSDDLWEPNALAVQVAMAQRHPESGLIVCDGLAFDHPHERDAPLFHSEADRLFVRSEQQEITGWFHRELVMGNCIACPAQSLLPRPVYEAVGPVCTTPNGIQDYDYYLRVARSFPITFHRASLARWRFRPDSRSGDVHERALRWASMSVEVLARERAAATPATKSYVDAGYHAHVRRATGAARDTLLAGGHPDPDDLEELYRSARWHRNVVATRLTLALPPPAGRVVARAARTAARALERRPATTGE